MYVMVWLQLISNAMHWSEAKMKVVGILLLLHIPQILGRNHEGTWEKLIIGSPTKTIDGLYVKIKFLRAMQEAELPIPLIFQKSIFIGWMKMEDPDTGFDMHP